MGRRYIIADRIYFDTFVIWIRNCIADTGEIGFEEYRGLSVYLKLRLFRLGRLQYVAVKAEQDRCLKGRELKAVEMALNLQIPQGEPLTLESCI